MNSWLTIFFFYHLECHPSTVCPLWFLMWCQLLFLLGVPVFCHLTLSCCFHDFFVSCVLQFDYASRYGTLDSNPVWNLLSFWCVDKCFSSNLGSFLPLILQTCFCLLLSLSFSVSFPHSFPSTTLGTPVVYVFVCLILFKSLLCSFFFFILFCVFRLENVV